MDSDIRGDEIALTETVITRGDGWVIAPLGRQVAGDPVRTRCPRGRSPTAPS
jgi:hypothetical protein